MKEQSKIIDVIKASMPAVVSIVISKKVADVEREMKKELAKLPPLPGQAPTAKVPQDEIDECGMVKVGGGSGFAVLHHKDGSTIILTNKHVIADATAQYSVVTSDNTEYETEILARDPINDVAILKIRTNQPIPLLPLGDSSDIELGQSAIAIGNALGIFKNTVSVGIVSGLSRAIAAQTDPDSPTQELRGLIQTDAAINPGNSGGPLLNAFGEVIGINTAIVFGAQSIGFTIPINAAKRDLEDLEQYGHIKRPLLGIRYVTVDKKLKEKLRLATDHGALAIRETHVDEGVIKGSPAAKAGIKEGDVILEWDGEKITQDKTILDYLETCLVGDTIILTVARGNKNFKTKVTLSERK